MTMKRSFFTPLFATALVTGIATPALAFEEDRLTIWMGDNKGQEGIRAVAGMSLLNSRYCCGCGTPSRWRWCRRC